MDKKKVIELIGKTKESVLSNLKKVLGEDGTIYKDVVSDLTLLDETNAELQKTDWISVEDELPPYGECVLVGSSILPSIVWISRRITSEIVLKDYHEFIILKGHESQVITHWHRIDKLEV